MPREQYHVAGGSIEFSNYVWVGTKFHSLLEQRDAFVGVPSKFAWCIRSIHSFILFRYGGDL